MLALWGIASHACPAQKHMPAGATVNHSREFESHCRRVSQHPLGILRSRKATDGMRAWLVSAAWWLAVVAFMLLLCFSWRGF
jgi:hypothetical protein